MNMGLGLALGTAMGNPALGLALGAAMPDPSASGSSSRRRRSSYESDYDRDARLKREAAAEKARQRAAAREAEDEALFQEWLKVPLNAEAYRAAKASDKAALKRINEERQAERDAKQAAFDAAVAETNAVNRKQSRRRIILSAGALLIGVITIAIGFAVGAPWLGTIFGAILGGLGVWGAYAYTPWAEQPQSPFGAFDRYHYNISSYEYETQGFGEAPALRGKAIRAARRLKRGKA